jgi:hypothetical protein
LEPFSPVVGVSAAHHIISPQRQFEMTSGDWKLVMNLSNQKFSKFTVWGQ